jgi:hypothetical protein
MPYPNPNPDRNRNRNPNSNSNPNPHRHPHASQARSGSTLLGELAFDPRRDFTYLYEPCRLRGRGQSASADGTRPPSQSPQPQLQP